MNPPLDPRTSSYIDALNRLSEETSTAAKAADKAYRDLVEEFAAREQLAMVRAKLVRFFYLLDIEEETDDGRPFHPNTLGGSCRALDAQEMNQLLTELKDWSKTTL
jgi:hypothetical protein